MKFITNIPFPKNGGVNYQALSRQQESAYSVTRLSDGKEAFTARRPRRDSKVWNKAGFMVWDLKNNCPA